MQSNIIGTRMKVMIRRHRKRRGAANAADTISSSSLSARKNENETKTTLVGRAGVRASFYVPATSVNSNCRVVHAVRGLPFLQQQPTT